MLNGDFLCNHLIIHQFSKRAPERRRVHIMLKGTAMRKEKVGRRKGLPGGNDQNGF